MKERPFYGWTALFGVMLVYFGLCGNIIYAYGIFLPSMSAEFGWSRSALSGPYGLFIIVGGLLGPAAGLSISRFGPRRNIVLFNFVAVLGLLGMARVSQIWHVYLFFGILGGLGIAFGEFISITTVVNNWFILRRAPAMGFLFASGGLGGFLFPSLVSFLISDMGWRQAWLCLAVFHFLLAVVLGGLLIRSRPEDVGQSAEGPPAAAERAVINAQSPARVYQTSFDWTVAQALRSPALWMIVALFSVAFFTLNMLTTHQVAFLQDRNFSPAMSAGGLGLMIGMSIIGRFLSGTLGARFEGRHLAACFMTGMGAGILVLMCAGGAFSIYVYSALTGIGFGGMIVLMPNLFGAYYGRTHYPRIMGWTIPASTLLAAAAPSLAGYLFDRTGTYLYPFALLVILNLSGALLALMARPPKQAGSRK